MTSTKQFCVSEQVRFIPPTVVYRRIHYFISELRMQDEHLGNEPVAAKVIGVQQATQQPLGPGSLDQQQHSNTPPPEPSESKQYQENTIQTKNDLSQMELSNIEKGLMKKYLSLTEGFVRVAESSDSEQCVKSHAKILNLETKQDKNNQEKSAQVHCERAPKSQCQPQTLTEIVNNPHESGNPTNGQKLKSVKEETAASRPGLVNITQKPAAPPASQQAPKNSKNASQPQKMLMYTDRSATKEFNPKNIPKTIGTHFALYASKLAYKTKAIKEFCKKKSVGQQASYGLNDFRELAKCPDSLKLLQDYLKNKVYLDILHSNRVRNPLAYIPFLDNYLAGSEFPEKFISNFRQH